MGGSATISTPVTVPADGIYNLTLFYISAETRSLVVAADGESATYALNGNGQGEWGSNGLMVHTIQVKLHKGSNELVFSAAGNGWAPNLDCFVLSPTDNNTVASGVIGGRAGCLPHAVQSNVCNLLGQCVADNVHGLAKGIYVVDGEAVIIR